MVKSDSDEDDKKNKYFDGSDPGLYQTWKRKSTLYLLGLPNTVSPEKHGAKLIGLLRGKAEEEVIEKIMGNPAKKAELTTDGGESVVYEMLDELYLPQRYTRLGEVLAGYYEMTPINKNESFRECMVREENLHRKLTEITTGPSPESRGWWLINKALMLNASQMADVMGYTKGDYKFEEVAKAVKFLFPNSMSNKRSTQNKETTGGRWRDRKSVV